MTITSLHGDCLDLLGQLAPASIQALITSPPYYGLRSYSIPPSTWPAVEYTPLIGLPPVVVPPMVCQLGAEPDPLAYIGHLVHVFRLARPALRADSTLWVNLGDSYSSGTQGRNDADSIRMIDTASGRRPNALAYGDNDRGGANSRKAAGIPDKNLLGIPSRAALALQADGWVWRSEIIWDKPNPMPESVRNRVTRSHEQILFFGNSARYYYDADAIREPMTESTRERAKYGSSRLSKSVAHSGDWHVTPDMPSALGNITEYNPAGRNKRSVWRVSTTPMPAHLRTADEAHYAAWPPALVEIMIRASSANKACSACGAAWVRQVERTDEVAASHKGSYFDRGATGERGSNRAQNGARFVSRDLGFTPACQCAAPVGRCVILDPFGGTGTTGAVAESLGRDSILIDLGYQTLQARRTDGIQVTLDALL